MIGWMAKMARWTPVDYNPLTISRTAGISALSGEMAEMLKVVGAESLEALIRQTVPASIRQAGLDWPALSRRRRCWRMRAVAAEEQGDDQPDRAGLLRHRDAARDPAQYSGKPGLVPAYTPYQPEIARAGLRRC